MKLPPDSRELLELFITRGVKFMVIGGWAMSLHRKPRTTGDLDLWVEPSPENGEKVANALHEFMPGVFQWNANDFTVRGNCFQIGRIPQRIDIITFADGLDFPTTWERRLVAELDGLEVSFPCKEDLLHNKQVVNRERDQQDVRRLLDPG